MRTDGRVVEGARLEREYTSKAYQEFESLSVRQITSDTNYFSKDRVISDMTP